jgi:hypothetical protein
LRRAPYSLDVEGIAAEVHTAAVADRTVEAVGPTAVVADSTVAEGTPALAVHLEAAARAERGASADLQTEACHLAALVDSDPAVPDLEPWAARTRVLVQV